MSETAELKVFDAAGKQVGTANGSAAVFGAPVSQAVLHEVVRWQRARKRSGTHSVKTRAEVSGGGIKPWKQKGTGNARAGSNTSPIWVGGGIAHGPKPRSYDFSLNRKQRRQAVCAALTARVQDERLIVVKDFGLKSVKTKAAAELLSKVGIEAGARVTIIVSDDDQTSRLSFRNLKKVTVLSVSGVNAYDVLAAEYIVLSQATLEAVDERLGSLSSPGRERRRLVKDGADPVSKKKSDSK